MECSCPCVEHFDELIHAVPAGNDGIIEGSTVGPVAVGWRAERVPENLVVKMPTAVEANQVGDLGHLFNVARGLSFLLLLK